MIKNNLLVKILLLGIASMVVTDAGHNILLDGDDGFRARTLAAPLKGVAYILHLDLSHPAQVAVAMLGSIVLCYAAGVLVWEFVAKRLGFDEGAV
jgi:hypothetical protein